MATQLVIFDPEVNRICAGNCCRIESFVAESFAASDIHVTRLEQFSTATNSLETDLVVLCVPPGRELNELVIALRQKWSSVPIVAAVCGTARTSAELLDSLRYDLDDFFCCPFHEDDLAMRLRRWLPDKKPQNASRGESPGEFKTEVLIGQSPVFVDSLNRIPQVAKSDATVLIHGETGAGKELFARAVHYTGRRRSRPFIPINCSALPEHLFENELFGHARGAYTDAGAPEKGLLAEAEGGTVFLDEVDTLAPGSQAKLLRFLQDRAYRPLGSTKSLIADVRVVAATNDDLRRLVAERRFRQDLYHRLNVLCMHIPPLRERASDIPLLSDHFLRRFAAQYNRPGLRISSGALQKLMAYVWPGNVRELESIIHRAVVFGSGDTLQPDDIELPAIFGGSVSLMPASRSKDHAMKEFERSYLAAMLYEHRGNVSHAARAAGKDRRTFQRLLRKYSIDRVTFRDAV